MRLSFCNSMVQKKLSLVFNNKRCSTMFQGNQSTKNHINFLSINKETFCTLFAFWLVENVLRKLRSIKSYWSIISLLLNCNLMRDEMSLLVQKTSFLLMFVSPTQNLGCLFFPLMMLHYLLWFIAMCEWKFFQ